MPRPGQAAPAVLRPGEPAAGKRGREGEKEEKGRVGRLWLFFLRKEERDGLRVWVAVGPGKCRVC